MKYTEIQDRLLQYRIRFVVAFNAWKCKFKYADAVKNRAVAREIGYAIFRFTEDHGKFPDKKSAALAANKVIDRIGFTNVEYRRRWFKPNEIIVTCKSPVMFVGHKGKLISYVERFIKTSKDTDITRARLVVKENGIISALTWYYSEMSDLEEWERAYARELNPQQY